MPVIDKPAETYEIKGVEIFSEGKWNGDEYTNEHLMQMVFAFEETKKGIPPYLKLGHNGKQKLLEEDGLPAAGWVDKVYVVGQKLMADFAHVPKKIYDLIKNKAYRKVSCEIYWNAKVNDKTYPKLLGAVALLGANTPGVMNLNDIMAGYFKQTDFEKLATYQEAAFEIKTYTTKKENGEMEKTAAEIKLEYDLKAEAEKREASEKENQTLKADLEATKAKQEADAKELERLKTFESEQTKKAQADAIAAKKLQDENFLLSLEKDNLVTPAMKPYIQSLIETVGEKKEYSVSLKDGEKKVGAHDLVKELLKLSKGSVSNFTETSVTGDVPVTGEVSSEDEKAIDDLMKQKNFSYGQAAKEVLLKKKG